MTLKAELVMESRSLAPQVRSGIITSNWAKLYKTEDHVIDISFKPTDTDVHLQGQLLTAGGFNADKNVIIRLRNQGTIVTHTQVDDWGQFKLSIGSIEDASLDISFAGNHIEVSELAPN